MSQSEAEEIYNRLILRPNIAGIILVNSDRVPIKSNITTTAEQTRYAAMVTALSEKARHCIRDLDPTNDLTFLRIRSKKNEIMVAPERDFTLIVIQKVTDIPRE
jgi:dynein light chain roadblock-type